MSEHLESYEGPSGDGALVRFLYPAPAERRPVAIFQWWEKRRPAYNLVVGTSGLLTLGLHTIVHGLPAGPDGTGVLGAIVAVGLLANVAYTLGSILEITAHAIWGRKVLPVGPLLFRQGLMFSVGLVLVLPTIILTIGAIAKTLGWIFGG